MLIFICLCKLYQCRNCNILVVFSDNENPFVFYEPKVVKTQRKGILRSALDMGNYLVGKN